MTAASAQEPRLAPLPPDQWDEDARTMLRGRVRLADQYLSGDADAPRMPNVLGILGHHPELAAAWLSYNAVLLERPTLDPRLREVVILRVAARTRCGYEWSQHARMATGLGLTPAQIDAIAGTGDPASLSPLHRLSIAAADQLVERHRVDDRTWTELTQHFDTRQLLELLFAAGSYLCLALVFNSVALQPDPETEERP